VQPASLRRNVAANYIGQGWRAVMSLAFVPVYIRYVGMEAYGLIGAFAVLQSWMSLLDMGMKPALAREMARFRGGGVAVQSIRDLLRSVETLVIVLAAAASAVVWMASGWLSMHWLKTQELDLRSVAAAIALMGVVASLRFIETIYISSVVGLQRQVLENVVSSVLATLRSVGAVAVLAWISPTINAFFVWQGVVSLLTVATYAIVTYGLLPRAPRRARFSRAALESVWRFATGMIIITFLSLLLTQADKILLSKLLPLKIFGYYSLAGTVAGVLTLLSMPIVTAFYPRFVELVTQRDDSSLRAVYHTAAQLVSVIVGAASMMLILFAVPVLRVWTGDPLLVANVAPLLSVLATGALLNALMWVPYHLQLAHGWTRLMVVVNSIAVAVLVPAVLVLVPRFGALAAAWVWVTLNAMYVLVVISAMHRRLLPEEKLRWYRDAVALPLGLALVAAWLFRLVLPDHLPRIAELLVLGAIGMVVLTIAAFAAGQVRVLVLRQLRRSG
jgi:O-antigen/teichoic acid export membrane protein